MQPEDEICYCYHVPMRKLVNFARRERPTRPSQMTNCLGAGTGCGWCIPFLTKIAEDPEAFALDDISSQHYADERKAYIASDQRNTFHSAGY